MSAYVVDPKVINRIVTALELAVKQEGRYPSRFPDLRYMDSKILRELVTDSPAELGRTLYAMNINAVEQRYPDGDLPGTYTDGERLDAYQYKQEPFDMFSAVTVYKSLSCLLYQCSEGNVPDLPLFKVMDEFKAYLAMHIVENMPEYDKAAWG